MLPKGNKFKEPFTNQPPSTSPPITYNSNNNRIKDNRGGKIQEQQKIKHNDCERKTAQNP